MGQCSNKVKIGVISDTHGVVPAWHKAMGLFANADLIIHSGDVLYHPPRIGFTPGYDIPALVQLINSSPIPIVIARGNCDPEVYEELLEIPVQSPYAFLQFGDLRILVYHGHNPDPEYQRRLAGKYRPSILITGHTHIPVIERIENTIHLNPGSPSHSKLERGGVLIPTVGLIEGGNVRVIEIPTGQEVLSMPLR